MDKALNPPQNPNATPGPPHNLNSPPCRLFVSLSATPLGTAPPPPSWNFGNKSHPSGFQGFQRPEALILIATTFPPTLLSVRSETTHVLCHFKRGVWEISPALWGYSNKQGEQGYRAEIKSNLGIAFDSSFLTIDLLAPHAHETLFTYFNSKFPYTLQSEYVNK